MEDDKEILKRTYTIRDVTVQLICKQMGFDINNILNWFNKNGIDDNQAADNMYMTMSYIQTGSLLTGKSDIVKGKK